MSPVMMEMNYEERPRRLSGSKRDSRELDGEDIRQAVADHDNKVAEMNYEGVRKGSLKAKASVFNRARRESQEEKAAPQGVRFAEVARKAAAVDGAAKILQTAGSGGTTHSMAPEECEAFADFINRNLAEAAPELSYMLPIGSADELFEKVKDGVVLAKLINIAAPETIDERVINLQPRNPFHVTENNNLVINAAKSIGLRVINIGSGDLAEGRPHLVLGLLWQLVKMALLNKINLRENPFLIRLLQEGETLEDLLKLPPEQVLLRWINFHLKEAGSAKRVANFGKDLADSEAYAILMSRIDPEGKASTAILKQQSDKNRRAEYVVGEGNRMQKEFRIVPHAIVTGNEKLNLAFCAALFNACPGLEPVEAPPPLPEEDDDGTDAREERAFRMWINSLGIERHIADLYDDFTDGVALLQLMDAVQPGIVPWARVNLKAKNVYQRLENLNLATKLATDRPHGGFGFSLVGVQGDDIANRNKKLVLALTWQLRRRNLLNVLSSLRKGSAKPLDDAAILKWANETVAAAGGARSASGFGDAALGDAMFFAELLSAVRPGAVDLSLLSAGGDEDAKKANAKYVLSVARKLGCTVFLLWEDVVEVKPKMMFSFCATIMRLALSDGAQ